MFLRLVVQSVSGVWLWRHELKHTRLPCPPLSPRVCSNSYPLSRWCHPTIASSVTPFSYPQSFPASGSFPMNRLCISGGQSIGASASASVLPMNIQNLFPLGLAGLIFCPRDFQESSPAPQLRSINSSALSLFYGPTLISIHDYWKNHSFDYHRPLSAVISLLFNMLSRFVIAFLKTNREGRRDYWKSTTLQTQ